MGELVCAISQGAVCAASADMHAKECTSVKAQNRCTTTNSSYLLPSGASSKASKAFVQVKLAADDDDDDDGNNKNYYYYCR